MINPQAEKWLPEGLSLVTGQPKTIRKHREAIYGTLFNVTFDIGKVSFLRSHFALPCNNWQYYKQHMLNTTHD
jgi:hypothetical protein